MEEVIILSLDNHFFGKNLKLITEFLLLTHINVEVRIISFLMFCILFDIKTALLFQCHISSDFFFFFWFLHGLRYEFQSF